MYGGMDSKNELQNLSLDELRARWQNVWGRPPHKNMGKKMLVMSLRFKHHEQNTGGLNSLHKKELSLLINAYRKGDKNLKKQTKLKVGTQLIRKWRGKTYRVEVSDNGFIYNDQTYTSLSKIATLITGTKWNGLKFFGVK